MTPCMFLQCTHNVHILRTTGRQYVAKPLQKYILALAQQVATEQGRPIVISTLVGRLHRRLQNVKETTGPKEEPSDDQDAEEQPLVIPTSSSEEETAKEGKRLTRAQKKKRVRTKCIHDVFML